MIGTNWVFRNKMGEKGKVLRNKARLVCNGYPQEESLEYEKTFAPMARIGLRTLLALPTCKGFKFYKINVKSTFKDGILEE